jgi:hypothetical protein
MDVTINNNQINVPAELATWGELLDWIETDCLKAGQCITHVYLAGTETYNYRDRLICEQALHGIGKVAIQSGDFDRIVRESLKELEHELCNTLVGSDEIVRLLENRKEEQAYQVLGQLLESIRIFYTIFSEDLGWIEPVNSGISTNEFPAVLERTLTQLIGAQETRNWVSICDVLEYEIKPMLEAWQEMVTKTREHVN